MGQRGKVSPFIFVASILCFFLPFLNVSCNGQKAASFTGVQLATGTSLEQPQMFGPPRRQNVSPDPFTAFAGLCALIGLGLSLVGARVAIVPAISGVAGAVSLLLMKSRMDDQVLKQGHGMLQVNYEIGYSLTLLLMVVGAGWNAFLFAQRKRDPAAAIPTPSPDRHNISKGALPSFDVPPATGGADYPAQQRLVTASSGFCPNCGAARKAEAMFCVNCGKPIGAVVQNG